MLKHIAAATLTALTVLTAVSLPIHAQQGSTQTAPSPEYVRQLNRAKNFARMAAERLNGGLGNYRAEESMHGSPLQSPYTENEDGTWTFSFKGRRPMSNNYTIETVVTVSRNGEQINVDYNGEIR